MKHVPTDDIRGAFFSSVIITNRRPEMNKAKAYLKEYANSLREDDFLETTSLSYISKMFNILKGYTYLLFLVLMSSIIITILKVEDYSNLLLVRYVFIETLVELCKLAILAILPIVLLSLLYILKVAFLHITDKINE